MSRRIQVLVGLLTLVALAACGNQKASEAWFLGTHEAAFTRCRGGLFHYKLVLLPESRAVLQVGEGNGLTTWEGDWTVQGEFILLRLRQSGLDEALLKDVGATAADIEGMCYVWTVLNESHVLSFIEESACGCDEDPGDLRDFIARIVTRSVKLSRVKDDPRSE